MLASVTLKRSLQQITNARTTAEVCRRSLSQAATHCWEPATEASMDNAQNQSSNGIIRFTMTPKPQQTASYRETSNLDDPLFDRTAAAEQMSKQMEDSYYFASFQAK